MSIATNQKLKELERRIEALEASVAALRVPNRMPQVEVRTIPNAPSITAQDDDDLPMGDAPPRGIIRRRTS